MSEQQRCGTCKFWGDPFYPGAKFRQCQAIKHAKRWEANLDEYGEHEKEPEDDIDRERQHLFRTSLALVVDGSGFFGAMKCSADFGCVLHQPKEA